MEAARPFLQRPAAATSVSLIGMPGSGKSAVGRLLSRALHRTLADSDHEIERRATCSVREYFDAHGEAAFRDLEQQVIGELLAGSAGVISTGGGVVLREANRRALHDGSTVVYLRSTPEELFRRLRHDTKRPLLQVADPLRKLRELFRERDPLYRETAHFVVETGRPSVHMLVNMILMQLELAGIVDPLQVPSPVGTAREG
jgi:shikimate kinase